MLLFQYWSHSVQSTIILTAFREKERLNGISEKGV